MSDKFQRAREVDIYQYMLSLGHKPVRDNSRRAAFSSPKRNENSPSFEVDKVKNRWTDRGEAGAFGDASDLVAWLDGCTVNQAADKLLSGDRPIYEKPPIEDIDYRPIEVVEVHDRIYNDVMIHYLEKERKIPIDVSDRYMKQVLFQFHTRKYCMYYGVGMMNDKEGWNIRSHWWKGSTKPAGVKTISGEDDKACMLFEGMMDFLSWVVLNGHPKSEVLILNSTVFVPFVLSHLQEKSAVLCYMDNDHSADEQVDYMRDNGVNLVDLRVDYADYKDLNEYLKTFDF